MAFQIQKGGGAGPWFGAGKVYVMKDVTDKKFKIGHSKDPKERLKQVIKQQLNPNEIMLLNSYEALESNRAETAAQKAAKEKLGLAKDSSRSNATDWFVNPRGASNEQICSVVKEAVAEHNKEEMKKQKK